MGFVTHVLTDDDRRALAATSLDQDRTLLDGSDLGICERLAISFRAGLKGALQATAKPNAPAPTRVKMGGLFK